MNESQAIQMLVREADANKIDTEERFVIRIPKEELIKFFNETFGTNFITPKNKDYPVENHKEFCEWLSDIKQKAKNLGE